MTNYISLHSQFNPLQPGVASLMFSEGIEKQHRAVMGWTELDFVEDFLHFIFRKRKYFILRE